MQASVTVIARTDASNTHFGDISMKKTLLAGAALLVSGAAMAQSSVTMYGVVDFGLGKSSVNGLGLDNGKPGSPTASQSFHTPTRIGVRGTEDLGNGLKANFNFESGGITGDDGSVAGTFWGREAWVGLSGNFGSTRLGRTSSFGTQGHARYDFNGISQSSAMDNAGVSPVTWYGSSRRNSVLQYVTPNMGGLEAGVAYVFSADNVTAGVGKSSMQFRVNYENGPMSVGYVAETKRTAANRTAQALAGSYDFGVAKVQAGYVVSESVARGKGWHTGVMAPFGAFYAGLQYARNTAAKVNATELFGGYNLSKRTSIYADYVRRTNNGYGYAYSYAYGVGIMHKF